MMKEVDELKKYRWSWWGQRAHDALGISQLTDLSLIVCCDWGSDIRDRGGEGRVASLEKEMGSRRNYSNRDLGFILRKGANKKKLEKKISRPLNCLMYRSVGSLEKKARSSENIKIISAPLKFKNKFDDKIFFRHWLRKRNIKALPGEVIKRAELNFSKIKRKWNIPFVLQYPVASSGEKTFLIHSRRDMLRAQAQNSCEHCIIMKYIPGFSLNINAVAGKEGVTLSPVSVQLIGSPRLTLKRFGFAGNDFSAARGLNEKIKNKIYDITLKSGRWMAGEGFRGMMGLDFLCSGSEIFPVEINPRFQNSTSLLTLLELKEKRAPLLFKHISQFIPLKTEEEFIFSPEGSQLILHSLSSRPLKIRRDLKYGIYKLFKGEVKYLRPGFSVNECRSPEEFALCCGVPFKGAEIQAGAPLVKLHFPRSVLKKDLINLKPEINLTVKKIYSKLIK